MNMNQTHPWWWRGRGGVGDGDVVKWGQRRGGGSGGEWVVVMERSPPLQSYAPLVVQQAPTFQPDTGLAIPTFLPTDDPIASLIKAMIFLITVQNVQGRESQDYAGNVGNNQASGARDINVVGNTWANQPRLQATSNFKADHVDAYDSDCDDEATANAIFMANLSPVGSLNDAMVEPCYDSNIHYGVPHYDTYHDSDMLNFNIRELGFIENIVSNNESYDEHKGNSDVISYTDYMLTIGNDEDNYVPPPVQKNDKMLFVIKQMKSQVEKCNKVNQEAKSVNESLTNELERYKDRFRILEYAVKDGHSEQEAYLSRFLRYLNNSTRSLTIDECIKRRPTLSPREIGSWEQSDVKGAFKADKIRSSTKVKLLWSAKSKSNTKNDRISQPPSRSMKNKVKARHRKFKSSSNKTNNVSDCNANVRNVALSKNSDTICLSFNECLFSANHDAYVVQYLKKMQKRKVAKSAKLKVKREYKPTRRIFKTV
ncbi:hypothetical protein Tco_0747526 [Tanacetum coccineum]|uniref:Uncharacterized protein n=1 Tax=Tanacetum coccineum TaxID=301880 RepID=A0ABQ4YTA5_9ASTR